MVEMEAPADRPGGWPREVPGVASPGQGPLLAGEAAVLAMAKPRPGQHQVWQGWPGRGRELAERVSMPWPPLTH